MVCRVSAIETHGLTKIYRTYKKEAGLWGAVIEHLNDAGIKTPVVRVAWPDQFIEHGAVSILQKKHGLTAEAAVEKVLPFVKGKKAAAPRTAA